eukprot:2978976-Heterocapsa_arctica.AAC.1
MMILLVRRQPRTCGSTWSCLPSRLGPRQAAPFCCAGVPMLQSAQLVRAAQLPTQAGPAAAGRKVKRP